MTYMVELRYIGGDLADLMRDMRTWLDHNQIDVEAFYHASGSPGLAFRIGFRDPDNAAEFAEAFRGAVECIDPQGAQVRWTIPPALGGQSPPSSNSNAKAE